MLSGFLEASNKYLSRFSIGSRIALLTFLPVAGMLIVCVQLNSQSLQATSQGEHVLNVADRVPAMSGLVHEFQIERGMTSGFISSGGAQFADQLPKQRQAVDAAVATFRTQFATDRLGDFDQRFRDAVAGVVEHLDGLDANRAAIDAAVVEAPAALGYYTKSINAVFACLGTSIELIEDTKTVENLITLESVTFAKEAAGLERATGAAVYASGKMTATLYQRLNALIGAQEANFEQFANMAQPEVKVAFDTAMAPSELETFTDYRKRMLDAPFAPDTLAGITGPQWFAASTERINRLRDVEVAANDAVIAAATRANADATARLIGTLSLTVAILGLSLIMAMIIARSIVRPLKDLTGRMKVLSSGDTSVAIDGVERRDEIGGMAKAVQVFKDNAIKVAAMSQEEHERIEQARLRSEAMSELIDALGYSVDAAVEGDFTRRIALEGQEQDLHQVATSVNTLLSTVERALGEIGKVLSELADKNLTGRVVSPFSGDFEQLKDNTNTVAERLGEIIGQLRGTSRTLRTATSEILSGANDLSERTTRQAATIEETSAAMEQLAHTVTENATRARDASMEAQKASETVEAGSQIMGRATEAMERISTSSGKISNIIGMIDDIAFQTNLLALNASVEAARAGEAGKGFAVVAVEVRRLAQSAAEASSSVKELIEQSSVEVRAGSKLVEEVSSSLSGILSAVTANTRLMEQIASDSHEQASSIGEVTTAVRQMDEMTQQNAALVEEMNAAIEQTESQASQLDGIVELFKLDEHTMHHAPEPKSRPAPVAAAAGGGQKAGPNMNSDWSEF